MTKDDIMMLANQTAGQHWMDEAHIQRFAVALISSEREDCAKLCDSFVDLAEAEKAKMRIDYARSAGDEEDELRAMRHELTVSTFNAGIGKCAAAIRARSQK